MNREEKLKMMKSNPEQLDHVLAQSEKLKEKMMSLNALDAKEEFINTMIQTYLKWGGFIDETEAFSKWRENQLEFLSGILR